MNLSDRLQAVVVETTPEYRRFKQLENLTNVQADTWKSWFHGRQRPTAEMIEAAGKAWPEYAFWLTTGISDPAYGHIAPGENGYPERSERKENSAALFKKQVEMKAEALKVARAYLEADGIPGYEPDDRFLSSTVQIVLKGYELSPNVDLSSYKAMTKAYPTARKLRSAEILLGEEMSDTLYDSIESVLEAVQKLLATVPDHAKERLEKILASEKKRQAGMKRISERE
jgi:hypothetical protein